MIVTELVSFWFSSVVEVVGKGTLEVLASFLASRIIFSGSLEVTEYRFVFLYFYNCCDLLIAPYYMPLTKLDVNLKLHVIF